MAKTSQGSGETAAAYGTREAIGSGYMDFMRWGRMESFAERSGCGI